MRNRGIGRTLLMLVAAAIAFATIGADVVPVGADGGVGSYVVGGQAIAEGQYPSLAAIMIDDPRLPARSRLMCTGTVVHPRWVMTAGHCADAVLFEQKIVAQVGSRDLGSPKAQTLSVNRAVVHKTYFTRGIGFDVALFHTAGTINAPVGRLSTTTADHALAAGGGTATAVGWGFTKQLGILQPPPFRARPPRRANFVDIPIVDDTTCADTYKDFLPGYFLPASDLCAGTVGKNVCYGDSGGPLYAKDPQGALVQIGITSRGAGCATKLFPAIFTEVHRIRSWIAKWTTTKCENKFEFPQDPDFPDEPFPTGPLYIC
jgi:secreted trypsin-like serine protease